MATSLTRISWADLGTTAPVRSLGGAPVVVPPLPRRTPDGATLLLFPDAVRWTDGRVLTAAELGVGELIDVAAVGAGLLVLGRQGTENVLVLHRGGVVWRRTGPYDVKAVDLPALKGRFSALLADGSHAWLPGTRLDGVIAAIDLHSGATVEVARFGAYRATDVWVAGGALYRLEGNTWVRRDLTSGAETRATWSRAAPVPVVAALPDGGALLVEDDALTRIRADGSTVGRVVGREDATIDLAHVAVDVAAVYGVAADATGVTIVRTPL